MEGEHTTPHTHKKESTFTTPMAIVVAGIIIGIAIFISNGKFGISKNEPLKDPELLAQVSGIIENPIKVDYAPITTEDFIRGNANAPLTFIEYSDTECPFCKRFHMAMNMVMDDNPNQIKWIYRHFPLDNLHKQARTEALATECAGAQGGSDGFWKYIDEVFKQTKSNDGLPLEKLPTIAQTVGLNVDTFNTCMKDAKLLDNVQKDAETGTALGVTGTPMTLIIGKDGKQYMIEGYRSYSVIKEIVRQLTEKK